VGAKINGKRQVVQPPRGAEQQVGEKESRAGRVNSKKWEGKRRKPIMMTKAG